jgi:hypothetical protein
MKLGTPAIQPAIAEELQPQNVTEELEVVADNQETTTLAPITRTMVPLEQVESKVVKLTPVKHMLTPVKRQILDSDE